MQREVNIAALVAGVRAGDRAALARAVTLVESSAPRHAAAAEALVAALLPTSGGALRLGISGVPGVGKSTLIDVLGTQLCDGGQRVAVLAIDPSSSVSGGSILGDKTRMDRLAVHPNAFVRPSPARGTLGGVARATRETIILCGAAGYDVVIVETVGVGQSETTVHDMVDVFLLLLLAGGGDELQGIKKGIVELADLLAITKADGDNAPRAAAARNEYAHALQYLGHTPPVLACSASSGAGLDTLWQHIQAHYIAARDDGALGTRRAAQDSAWMQRLIDDGLRMRFASDPAVQAARAAMAAQVAAGTMSPWAAARALLAVHQHAKIS